MIASFATKELTLKLSEEQRIKSADPEPAADAKSQGLNQIQEKEQVPADPEDILKQAVEKELGNFLKVCSGLVLTSPI